MGVSPLCSGSNKEKDLFSGLPALEVCFGKESVSKSLDLDNSMIENGELKFLVTAKAKNIAVRIFRGQRAFRTIDVSVNGYGIGRLRVVELLKWIGIGERAKVIVAVDYGDRQVSKQVTVHRQPGDIIPDQSKTSKSLQPLYDEIAKDLKAGKPLVITTNVALWDASFAPFSHYWGRKHSNGRDPKTNLYWGGGLGVASFFKRAGWHLVKKDYDDQGRDKLAVFKKTFSPNHFWQGKGVTKRFDIYAVFNVYLFTEIVQAHEDFALYLYGKKSQTIALENGQVLEAGGNGQVVGYVGHMHKQGIEALNNQWMVKGQGQPKTKGVYVTSCFSAQHYAPYTLDNNTYGLLYTTGKMAPEGYNQEALFTALAQGFDGRQIILSVAQAYDKYQKDISSPPAWLFVNSQSQSIAKYSRLLEGDLDADAIPNYLDPQPQTRNQSQLGKQDVLLITTSAGRVVTIELDSRSLPTQFFEYLHIW